MMKNMSRKAMQERLNRLQVEVRELEEALMRPRFVQVVFQKDLRRENAHTWDYIDGIGTLQIGDRVICPTRFYGTTVGVVVSLCQEPEWPGPYSTIEAWAHS